MKLKHLSLTAVFILSSCASYHQTQLYKQNPAFYSYIIGDVKTNHIDEEYASEVYATPASCQKTVTALTALKFLGANYRYQTKVFRSGTKDLLINFSGDPTLTSQDLLTLLEPLKNTKNRDILLDVSTFQTPPYSPNIIISDIGTAYSTAVSSANIDQNLINLKIAPNQIIQADVDYEINSNVITNSETSKVKLSWNGRVIEASGNINFNDQLLELRISPSEIDFYLTKKVKNVLKLLNISGKIKIIHEPKQLTAAMILINTVESQSLKEFIIPALKKSDNLVFDSLYLKIIHTQNPEIKDWSEGDKIIKDLIQQYFEIDFENALFVDGSGLSRYNRIQPKKLLALLKKGFEIPEFIEALPKAGEEKTTLEKRYILPKNLKAKTGNILGITCLCGYSSAKNPKAFVIMSNSFAPPSTKQFGVIDNFIRKQVE